MNQNGYLKNTLWLPPKNRNNSANFQLRTLGTLGITTPADVAAYYTVADPVITAGPPTTFVISAVPIVGKAQAGDGTLSINSSGVKLPAGVW